MPSISNASISSESDPNTFISCANVLHLSAILIAKEIRIEIDKEVCYRGRKSEAYKTIIVRFNGIALLRQGAVCAAGGYYLVAIVESKLFNGGTVVFSFHYVVLLNNPVRNRSIPALQRYPQQQTSHPLP